MDSGLPQLSGSQWDFLAVLEVFGDLVPIDVAEALAPLTAGHVLDLLSRTDKVNLLRTNESGLLGLAPDVPPKVLDKLKTINTSVRISAKVDRLQETGLMSRLNPALAERLFLRAGRFQEAARVEIELAREALGRSDHETATAYLKQAAAHYTKAHGSKSYDPAFVAVTLELSDLSLSLGKGFSDVPLLLENCRDVAKSTGDRRSSALIDLHLGRFFYFVERRSEALALLTSGWKQVEDLGDADILTQSAEFLGLFFFVQGLFKEAMVHYERMMASVEYRKGSLANSFATAFVSQCTLCLGQFHRSIGLLESHWHSAEQDEKPGLAATYRALLGHALLRVNKRREALCHLNTALQNAVEIRNALAAYFARVGLAIHSYLCGRSAEARELLSQAVEESKQSGIIRQWASPWILEMLFEFHRLGFDPIADMSYQSQVERVFREPNVHLKGVALRLRAKEAVAKGEDKAQIRSLLEGSEQDLKRSGDPVELSKTLMEMARLEVSRGDRQRARELAQNAWDGLSGYTEEFFSDDLRHLLQLQRPNAVAMRMLSTAESVFGRFLDMMEELVPSDNLNEIMVRAVGATNRFLGAERGGLFWFQDAKKDKKPRLRASCNLTEKEVYSDAFRSSLSLITRCFSERKPFLVRPRCLGKSQEEKGALAILCLPVEVGGRVRGVLYHDNSYLDDCFDFLDGPLLVRVVRHLSKIVDRVWDYERLIQEKSWQVSDEVTHGQGVEEGEILARSPVTLKLLIQGARVAQSESIVLLLGETGVGKELLARYIHKKSSRRDRPYVIIDIPTIPDNLLESELFGQEKGAFTGADNQKRGRIELAHGGTLFLDEIGELPLPIQSKLLRLLDAKTFVRLGGSRSISSDFRLVAATNRDLAREVSEGRFRKDLYYRLNVVPMTIPPLRERKEDVILLARHYLSLYARKFNRPPPELTSADEESLTDYEWPGNIRELKNVMERAVLLSTDDHLKLDLPLELKSEPSYSFSDLPKMDELQRRYIQFVLNRTGNRISGKGGAAELLGMDRLTLYRRMKKLNLR